MNVALLSKLISFGLVGISGILIDFSITWFLKEKLRLNKYLANAAGFSAAVLSNFILNSFFTFKNSGQSTSKHLTYFVLIALIGLLVNTGILKLLQQYTKLNFYLCKAITIGIVFFWNFFANHYFNYGA